MIDAVYPCHDKDLSASTPPNVIETFDYEALLQQRKNALNGLYPFLIEGGEAVYKPATLIKTDTETYWKIPFSNEAGLFYVDLESDPAAKILQADTYRELLIRQRINEAAVSTMIAYATGSDLDHIAANWGLTRLTVTPATTNTPAVLESDNTLRKRTLLTIEDYARGGSKGWYEFNTLSASGLIKDVSVVSPVPCEIIITVLSHEGNGVASPSLLQTVRDYIDNRNNRVLGDVITVQSAEIVNYSISAEVQLYKGPSASAVLNSIQTAWSSYRAKTERIGHGVYQSAIDAVLQQAGVYKATIKAPALPLNISAHQAPYCVGLNLTEVFE